MPTLSNLAIPTPTAPHVQSERSELTACLQAGPVVYGIEGLVPTLIATWVQAIIATGDTVKNVKEGLQQIINAGEGGDYQIDAKEVVEVLEALGLDRYSKLV